MVFKAIHGLTPLYLSELLVSLAKSRVLRSNNKHLLVVPKTKLVSGGDRAFSSVAPRLWNSIPEYQAESVQHFKTQLKTYLFKKAFCL